MQTNVVLVCHLKYCAWKHPIPNIRLNTCCLQYINNSANCTDRFEQYHNCDNARLVLITTMGHFFSSFFSVRLLSVLRGHSGFSYLPQRPMTSDFEEFSIPDFIHYIYFPILILEKEPVFSLLNVQCLNKGTTGTIFITSLV